MPPRYAYWTIIAGGLPTAFRAAHREELLPTFHRIREKHPDAEMKWFARGKLWESQEAARIRRPASRDSGGEGRRPEGGQAHPRRKAHATRSPEGEKRGRDWRPGGEHRDPRQKFIDANKRRNAAQRKERWEKEKERATEERPAPRRPARRPFDPRTRHRKGPRR